MSQRIITSQCLPELLLVSSLLNSFSVTTSTTVTEALQTSHVFSCPDYICLALTTSWLTSPNSNWPHCAHLGQPVDPFPMDVSTSVKLPTSIWLVVTEVSFNDKEKTQPLKPFFIFAIPFNVLVFLNHQLLRVKDAVWLHGMCLALWKHCH